MLATAIFIVPEKAHLIGVKASIFSQVRRHANKNWVRDCNLQEHLETTGSKRKEEEKKKKRSIYHLSSDEFYKW